MSQRHAYSGERSTGPESGLKGQENQVVERFESQTILIADDSPLRRREVVRAVEGLPQHILEVSNFEEAVSQLGQRAIDVVIADVNLPGGGAIDLCKVVKCGGHSERIPVLVLGRAADLDNEVAAMEAGADAFLMGPLRSRAFRARVQGCLRRKAMVDSLDETETVLFSLAQSVEGRDPALGLHCERLALIAAAMGVSLGLPPSDILALQRGGYLHDVGKVGIPDSVLLKPGPLTQDEWAIMKTHPERGEKICASLRSLTDVLPIIRHHHERWDGSGYPDGLKGDEIPLLARILQFADIYDALTADRPYKKAFSSEAALEIMRNEAAKGWRDPELMAVFERIVPIFTGIDTTADSLKALSKAIERCRTGVEPKGPETEQPEPVKLVSGL